MGEDYYKLLGIPRTANVKEISSAYRSKALLAHPDKCGGDDTAFHALSKAYNILIDPEARRALDALLASREAYRVREQNLDVERRHLRDELLKRERLARKRKAEEDEAEANLRQEMERLRRQGKFDMENAAAQKIEKDTLPKVKVFDDLDRTLKIKCKTMLTEEFLKELFKPLAQVDSILVRKKAAVVQFPSVLYASTVMQNATKFDEHFSSLEWAKGHPPDLDYAPTPGVVNEKDFESLTLMRIRQQTERARLRANLEQE